jgi:hypothetical protein
VKKPKSKKRVTRKDGKPTRAERKVNNAAAFRKAKEDLAKYVPPSARARMQDIIDQMKSAGELKTEVELQQAILSLVAAGLSLRQARTVCDVEHMQWHRWLKANEELKTEYNLAKEERAEAWADDIMEDAEHANAFNVQAVRLRIETKKWLMGKHNQRYADKQIIAGDPENPLRTISTTMSPKEAQEAYAQMKGNKVA